MNLVRPINTIRTDGIPTPLKNMEVRLDHHLNYCGKYSYPHEAQLIYSVGSQLSYPSGGLNFSNWMPDPPELPVGLDAVQVRLEGLGL